jgi:hypothetical protein
MEFDFLNIILYLLALAGVYASFWWSIENLISVAQIILGSIVTSLQSKDKKSLTKKYGTWAGKICYNQ